MRFVQQASRPHGQWDGIVAFSQGATLVSLLCALSQPHFTRFAVLISGSPSRAADHRGLFRDVETGGAKRIEGVKTLNIYGKQDEHAGTSEEMKERTVKLAEMFGEGEIVEHGGGHFTPQWWPWEKICHFILEQGVQVPENLELDDGDCVTVEERIQKIREYAEMVELFSGKDRESFARCSPTIRSYALRNLIGKILLQSNSDGLATREETQKKYPSVHEDYYILYDEWRNICLEADEMNEILWDDLFVWVFHVYYLLGTKQKHYFDSMLAQLAVCNPDYIIKRMSVIVKFTSWQKVNDLVRIIWDLMASDNADQKNL